MIALDVKKKNVLTTPFSFVATGTSIVHAGGIPDFVDVSAIDYNIDPRGLGANLDNGTKAVLPVHLFGRPAKIDEIRDRVGNDARIIEDAAQAHGAELHGRKVGSLGDAGCFSFYPTKNMTVGGDGGMVTTNDKRVADDIRKFRDCGRVSRYEHDVFGFTSRLNTANAAFGRVQLKHLDEWNERRREIARRYLSKLNDVEQITLAPMDGKDSRSVYHLFTILCQDRNDLAKHLDAEGIDNAIHYPIPIHMQPIYRETYGPKQGKYPIAEDLANRMLSIPMFPGLTDEQVDTVSSCIIDHYGGN
uniref:DegT/DnrJ/EryC1/StrS family aminotransferase n=1 Tax=Methanomassiliicoccus luminyensis TaxID=1080712 RepID=UPI00036661C1|nr:DegT/DnrJ/EryC1/StrS family aminotransferase [Methanomassiliicoccus luminyensis]